MNTDSTIFGGKLMKWLLFCITLLAFTQIKAQPCSNPPVMNLTGGGAVCENSTTVWFRNRTSDLIKSNDLIFLLGINANISDKTRMKINYSYDFVLTEIRPGAGASHEVTITFELDDFSLLKSRSSGFGFSPRNSRSKEELECTPF